MLGRIALLVAWAATSSNATVAPAVTVESTRIEAHVAPRPLGLFANETAALSPVRDHELESLTGSRDTPLRPVDPTRVAWPADDLVSRELDESSALSLFELAFQADLLRAGPVAARATVEGEVAVHESGPSGEEASASTYTSFDLAAALGTGELVLRGAVGSASPDALARADFAVADANDPWLATYATELELTLCPVDGVSTSWILWGLDAQSEIALLDGTAADGARATRRFGLDGSGTWSATDWLDVTVEGSVGSARYRDGETLPGAVETVIGAGLVASWSSGLFGGAGVDWLLPHRPIDEGVGASALPLAGAHVGFGFAPGLALVLETTNLLGVSGGDAVYTSRRADGLLGPEDTELGPVGLFGVDARTVRIAFVASF